MPNAGVIQESETNNNLAQTLRIWTRKSGRGDSNPNIGDTTANTSTTIKHLTIEGTGDDGYDGFFIPPAAGGLDRPTGSTFEPIDGNFYVSSAETD